MLRLHPRPASIEAAFCGLPDYSSVVRLLATARQTLGPRARRLRGDVERVLRRHDDQAQGRAPAACRQHKNYVLLEAHGTETDEGHRLEGFLGRVLEDGLIEDAAVAQNTGADP